jgi:hypothetical protein
MKGLTKRRTVMHSTLYHENLAPTDDERPAKDLKGRLGDQLDEIAVFALVAVAVFYIAAASCWFLL